MLAISIIIIVILGLIIATVIDIKQRRIPNWLTVSMTVVGLINSGVVKGWLGLGEHLLAMLFGLLLFFIFYLMGIFGAGDAKMMAALGAVMGIPLIFYNSISIILVGGLVSFIQLVRKDGLKKVMYLIYFFMKSLFTGKLKEFNHLVQNTSNNTFPFSIAIIVGSVMTLWYMYPNY